MQFLQQPEEPEQRLKPAGRMALTPACNGVMIVAMSHPAPFHGKWFRRSLYIVFPNLDNVLSTFVTNYRKAFAEIKAFSAAHPIPPEPQDYGATSQEERKHLAEVLSSIIATTEEVERERVTKMYNAQPRWSMTEIHARTVSEASEILREFFEVVGSASKEFGWWEAWFIEMMTWMAHSWKHVTLADLERVANRAHKGEHPFDDLGPHFDVLCGSGEDFRALLVKAAERVPEAVARLNYLVPRQRDLLSVARSFLSLPQDEISRLVSRIPSAGQVAAECAQIAVTNPDSAEAERARRTIASLVAKGSARGSRVGRPRISYSGEALATVYRMSYALYKQVREVNRFVMKLLPSSLERSGFLAGFYPWLDEKIRPERLADFAKRQPTEGACEIASKELGLSISKVRKSALPPMPNRPRGTSP